MDKLLTVIQIYAIIAAITLLTSYITLLCVFNIFELPYPITIVKVILMAIVLFILKTVRQQK